MHLGGLGSQAFAVATIEQPVSGYTARELDVQGCMVPPQNVAVTRANEVAAAGAAFVVIWPAVLVHVLAAKVPSLGLARVALNGKQ